MENKEYINTELLRYQSMEVSNGKIKNNYLKKLLTDISVLEEKHNDNTIILTGKVNLLNVIKKTSLSKYNTTSHICKIRDGDTNPNKIKILPDYFIDIIKEYSSEYKNAGIFGYKDKDNTVTIIPDIYTNNIIKDLDSWNIINKFYTENKETDIGPIYSFLFNKKFSLFLNDVTYNDIFKIKDSKILKDIKDKIYQFYDRFFFGNEYDKLFVKINVNTDTKYEFILFEFTLFDIRRFSKYTSYNDYYRHTDIDDLINIIENKEELSYYTRVKSKQECINIHKSGRRQNGGAFNDIIKNIDDYEVVVEYSMGNFKHSYCSEFITLKYKEKYYDISIKSITFDALMCGKNTDFYDEYIGKLKENIKKKPIQVYGDDGYYNGELPAIIEVIITETDNLRHNYKNKFFIETKEDYHTKILKLIKKSADKNDYWLVLRLLWKSEFRQFLKILSQKNNYEIYKIKILHRHLIFDNPNEFEKFIEKTEKQLADRLKEFYDFTQNLLGYIDIGIHLITSFYLTDNFQLDVKLHGEKKVSEDYKTSFVTGNVQEKEKFISEIEKNYPIFIIWYNPIDLSIKGSYNEILSTLSTKNTSELFKHCNFNELYQKEDFVHNMRHINKDHKDEINKLLVLLNIKVKNLNDMMTICHYPNVYTVNIFHLHHFPHNVGKKDEIEKLNNYLDTSISRVKLWRKISDRNMDRDMIININVDYNLKWCIEKKEEEKEKEKKCEELYYNWYLRDSIINSKSTL